MSWLYTVLFAGLLFSSQNGNIDRLQPENQPVPAPVVRPATETEHFEQTYPLSAGGRVGVSNVNGSIKVEGWDRNEVKLEYTKTADSKERLADVKVIIEARADSLLVQTDYGNGKMGNIWKNGGMLTVDFVLMVPRGAVLNEIETVNGSVSLSGLTNSVKASAVNGSVAASGISGTAKLATVNGEVSAEFDRIEGASRISLETVNGKVNLALPSDVNATVKAESVNGNITNQFGLPVRKGKYVGRDLYGKLGNGEVEIKLESVNGPLAINRRNDGRNLSPAVNMLPQKDSDDDEWDMGLNSEDMAKMNRDLARASREMNKATQKNVAKAMAEAQAKMNSVEVQKATAESIKRSVETAKASIQAIDMGAIARIADINFLPQMPRVEDKSGSFQVKGTPKVTIDAKGCSVSVRGWDKNEVQYRVTRVGGLRGSSPLAIQENHTDTTVDLSVSGAPAGAVVVGEPTMVRIEVFVPKRTNLKINASGAIRLDGVSGELDLTGGAESINVRDGEGSLTVASRNGRIRVIGFRGSVDATTSDAPINLDGDFSSLSAKAGVADVIITLPEGAAADIDSTAGSFEAEGFALKKLSGEAERGRFRIGNGGNLYKVETRGEVRVRSAATIRESN